MKCCGLERVSNFCSECGQCLDIMSAVEIVEEFEKKTEGADSQHRFDYRVNIMLRRLRLLAKKESKNLQIKPKE